jgi:hypothetical protein
MSAIGLVLVVLVFVVAQVVVQGAAGVRHEDALHGRLQPALLSHFGLERLWRVLDHDPAVVDDPDPVAEPIRLRQVVRGQHDRGVMRVTQLLDEGLHVQLGSWIQAGRRLVEQQQGRAGQQGSRDGDLLLHPPAHLLQRPAEALLADPKPRQDRDRLGPRGPRLHAVQPRGVGEVLERAQLLEEGCVHAHPVDDALDRHLVPFDVVAEHLDPSGVQREQRADQPDQGRLAAPVGAQHAVDLAPADPDRDVVHGHHALALAPAPDHELLGDVLDEQGRNAVVRQDAVRARGRRRSPAHRLGLLLFQHGGHLRFLGVIGHH